MTLTSQDKQPSEAHQAQDTNLNMVFDSGRAPIITRHYSVIAGKQHVR